MEMDHVHAGDRAAALAVLHGVVEVRRHPDHVAVLLRLGHRWWSNRIRFAPGVILNGPAWKCRCSTPVAAEANDGLSATTIAATTAATTPRFTPYLLRGCASAGLLKQFCRLGRAGGAGSAIAASVDHGRQKVDDRRKGLQLQPWRPWVRPVPTRPGSRCSSGSPPKWKLAPRTRTRTGSGIRPGRWSTASRCTCPRCAPDADHRRPRQGSGHEPAAR